MFELNDETRWILGQPNFSLIGYAQILRLMGHDIKTKSEDEQACVIYWMLTMYEQHGENWREEASKVLKVAIQKAQYSEKKNESTPIVTECPYCNREYTNLQPGDRCNASGPSGDGGIYYCPGRVKRVRHNAA